MKANKMVSLDIACRSTRYLMQFESICSIVIFFHTDLINQELYVTIIYYVKAQKLLKKLPFKKKCNYLSRKSWVYSYCTCECQVN